MAEIRKHDPSKGNAMAQALRAAMGEDIRPRVPGQPAPAASTRPVAEPRTTWVSLRVEAAQPAAEPEDDPEEDPEDD
jgi:hypothetical protein